MFRRPPVLAVEVLSDSTRSKDQIFKRALYADSGVELYWIFDPKVPRLTAYRLTDGEYVETAGIVGDETLHLDEPYPVRARPSDLARG